MSLGHGLQLSTSGLVYYIDPSNTKSMPGIGCGGFNTAKGIASLINSAHTSVLNNLTMTGRQQYYTAFAITYPEGSYGGPAAARQGLYTGFNSFSGGAVKLTLRGISMWVWNNDTNNWIPDSYIHAYWNSPYYCYDTYVGSYAADSYPGELARFVSDYNTIKNTFPNCSYILAGSHAADNYSQDAVNVLMDLGAPSLVNSWVPSPGRPEWLLAGKPGLGAGNAYGWAYENYTTDPQAVAHMNLGLPFGGTGALTFNGTSDILALPDVNFIGSGTTPFSTSIWMYQTKNFTDGQYVMPVRLKQDTEFFFTLYRTGGQLYLLPAFRANTQMAIPVTQSDYVNKWLNITITYNGGSKSAGTSFTAYLNGVALPNGTVNLGTAGGEIYNSNQISGDSPNTGNGFIPGYVGAMSIYNRALSAIEVMQTVNAHRGRYGV